MIEFHEEAIAPGPARWARLDAPHVRTVSGERRERIEERAGDVIGGQQNHRAGRRTDGERLRGARERKKARLIVSTVVDVGPDDVECVALCGAAIGDDRKLRVVEFLHVDGGRSGVEHGVYGEARIGAEKGAALRDGDRVTEDVVRLIK